MNTSYWVASTGDDIAGDGSYSTPFATIERASQEAALSPVDVIEVAAGTVVEDTTISSPIGFRMIRGRGALATTISLNLISWLEIDSIDAPSLVIADATLKFLVDDAVALTAVASDATAGHVTFSRCRVQTASGAIVAAYTGPDPQTFIPQLYVDLLHCVVEGTSVVQVGSVFAGTGSPVWALAARNCIFRRLAAVNKDSTQPFDSDANVYHDNERDLTLGKFGALDLRIDPQLALGQLEPTIDSPLVGAGVDLSSGYGYPTRTPSPDVGLLYQGDHPTIGVLEPVELGARTGVVTTNIHTIVSAMAPEAQTWRDERDAVQRDRSLRTASALALSRRFGALTGIRNTGGDVETYRKVLQELLRSTLEHAPTWHAVRRAAEMIAGRASRLNLREYARSNHYKIPRWRLGSSLKLIADASGGLPTFDYYLTAGEIRLEDRWIRVRQAAFTAAAADAVHTVYVDGADALDGDDEAFVKTSTDTVNDESLTLLPGLYTFRTGETLVETTADIPATVLPHRRLATGFDAAEHVVEVVDGTRQLTLRHPYEGEDHVGKAWIVAPNYVFGRVTVDATNGITAIECPGRLGHSTRVISHETRGHAYELELDAAGTALDGATDAVRLLFEVIGRAHPIHKRGYFRLRDDTQALVLAQPWPYAEQSSIDYSEIFDDTAWLD